MAGGSETTSGAFWLSYAYYQPSKPPLCKSFSKSGRYTSDNHCFASAALKSIPSSPRYIHHGSCSETHELSVGPCWSGTPRRKHHFGPNLGQDRHIHPSNQDHLYFGSCLLGSRTIGSFDRMRFVRCSIQLLPR